MTTNKTTAAPTIWIARVPTRYEITAVATDGPTAIREACTAALAWLRKQGVRDYSTAEEVREYFGVVAFAVPMGGAVVEGTSEYCMDSI